MIERGHYQRTLTGDHPFQSVDYRFHTAFHMTEAAQGRVYDQPCPRSNTQATQTCDDLTDTYVRYG